MLDWFIGASLAVAVCAVLLGVAIRVSAAIFGNLGTALMLGLVAIFAAFAGWKALIHSGHLPVQMLGWALAGLVVWCALKGTQVAIRKVRAPAAVEVAEVDNAGTV